jgi:hypothetical protein
MNTLVQPIRQCAWCYRVMDIATGQYRLRTTRKIQSATHGICPSCKDVMRAQIDASPALLLAA